MEKTGDWLFKVVGLKPSSWEEGTGESALQEIRCWRESSMLQEREGE